MIGSLRADTHWAPQPAPGAHELAKTSARPELITGRGQSTAQRPRRRRTQVAPEQAIMFPAPTRVKPKRRQLPVICATSFRRVALVLALVWALEWSSGEPTTGSIFDSLLGKSSGSHQHQSALMGANQSGHSAPASGALEGGARNLMSGQASDKVTLPGDILLGGLFPIHMKGSKAECGEINRDRGIQRLEAMLYALDRINEDQTLLPDIKLGAILLDSCSSSTYALNQSLEFIRASINTVESSAFECKDKSTPRPKYGSKMIAGVIGGSYSEVSLQVANLLRLFRIPQVSYASTGTALSDKTLYDLFARTVPSDMFQARAIADIVLKLNWSYVSLVSSEGLYGDSGSKEFMKQASAKNICIAIHEKISPAIGHGAYDAIVASLRKRNATGVVLFTRVEDSRALLLAVKRAGLHRNFAWIAADGWGTHQKLVEDVELVARGAITVELQAKAIPGFDQYMKARTPWANARNPWFSEYWQEWFGCQLQPELLQQQRLAAGLSAYYPTGDGGVAAAPEPLDSGERERSARSAPAPGQCGLGRGEPTGGPAEPARLCINAAQIAESKRRRQRRARDVGSATSASASVVPKVKQFCSPNLRINESNGYRQEQKVQFVVDAVYAMAHALHRAWRNLCHAQPGVVCEALKELNGADFYTDYLLNVSFKDLAGSEVKFDEHGDGLGRYNIYNFRRVRVQHSQEPTQPQAPEDTTLLAPEAQPVDSEPAPVQPPTASYYLANDSARDPITGWLTSGRSRRLPASELSTDASTGAAEALDEVDNQPAAGEQEAGDTGEVGGNTAGEDSADPSQRAQQAGPDPETAPAPAPASPASATSSAEQSGLSSIEHIYTSNTEFEYSLIGRWSENEFDLRLDDIQSIMGEKVIPESYCSRPCELGQAKIMRAGDQCCWICKTCQAYEFLPDEFSCRDCGIGRWPVANKTSCFELPQKILRWSSVYSLISLTIACLGIALTLFVSIIFIKYLDTPVVKASGRELSFILLAGIAFCHLSTFILLSKPTTFICGSQRFLVNFGFALMYASLLVKTNRISRIFNCARKSAKRPSFISPKSQMLITGILVAIQIFLTIVWFVLEPPGIRADSPEGKRDEVILKCRTKGKSFIISLVYNMILITTCTVYAVKTRKIPENFNESKFIGFTMYTTIVIWLAFVTMFFGTNNSYEIQINTMCVCISLSAYVTLFCLFSPKISIILLHPDKNVRKLTMNSATYKRPFKPVSSLASVDGRERSALGGVAGGPHTDAGSAGGPMSTTSNVLNLDGNRLQESSVASNVANSNSGASNCSQTGGSKSPAAASHQQLATLVGVCSNCGAHQVARLMGSEHQLPAPTAASGAAQPAASSLSQHRLGAGAQTLAAAGKSASASVLRGEAGGGARPAPATCLASNRTAANRTQQQLADSGAKIVHCSRVTTDNTTTTTNLVKRNASDDFLVGHQQELAFATSNGIPVDAAGATALGAPIVVPRDNHRKYVASLSRLNDTNTSTTSSNRVQGDIDESYSSLANDSFAALTSQDNTPCNLRRASGGARLSQAHNHQFNMDSSAKVASDSMLCNESIHSMDYCSECCPNYECQCSCPVCSSTGPNDEFAGTTTTNVDAYCVHGNPIQVANSATLATLAPASKHDDYDPIPDSTFVSHLVDEDSAARFRRHKSQEAEEEEAQLLQDNQQLMASNSIELKTMSSSSGATSGASAPKSVMYSIQAAAQTALGATACTVSQVAAVATSGELQSQSQRSSAGARSSGSTSVDKKSSGRELVPSGGTIKASLELVKSVGNQKRARASAGSSSRQQESASHLANHEDFDYGYGLVRSDSETGPCFYDDDEDDEEEDDDDDYEDDDLANDDDDDDFYDDDDDHLSAGPRAQQQQSGRKQKTRRRSSGKSLVSTQAKQLDDDIRSGGERYQSFGAKRRTTGSGKKLASTSKKIDEHRINSVALITATLSAGGAIVDSGASQALTPGASGGRAESSEHRDAGDRDDKDNKGERMTFITTI